MVYEVEVWHGDVFIIVSRLAISSSWVPLPAISCDAVGQAVHTVVPRQALVKGW